MLQTVPQGAMAEQDEAQQVVDEVAVQSRKESCLSK
jgi:hypothetical protein